MRPEAFPPLTLGLLLLQDRGPFEQRRWQPESRETRDATLCCSSWEELWSSIGKGWPSRPGRDFGNISALMFYLCGVKYIGLCEIKNLKSTIQYSLLCLLPAVFPTKVTRSQRSDMRGHRPDIFVFLNLKSAIPNSKFTICRLSSDLWCFSNGQRIRLRRNNRRSASCITSPGRSSNLP